MIFLSWDLSVWIVEEVVVDLQQDFGTALRDVGIIRV